MHYYSFTTKDQTYNNWLLFDPRPEHPYVALKERFKPFCCPLCKKFSHDEVFREGFDSDVRIRAKGDIFTSDEGFLCISRKLKLLIDESGFRGLEAKTVGDGNWFVINETWRVSADSATYEISKNTCSNCGRAGVTGLFDYLSQIEVPAESGIFSPQRSIGEVAGMATGTCLPPRTLQSV